MASEVQICNLALKALGQPSIASLSEGGAKANTCSTYYAVSRDELISAHDWSFARKRRSLALLSETSVGRWTYTYQRPVDCIKPLFIESTLGHKNTPFRVEGDTILTNEQYAELVYSSRVTDTTKFPADFIKALSTYLAAKMAKPLTGSNTLATEMWKLHLMALEEAELDESKGEIDESTEQVDTWLAARQ